MCLILIGDEFKTDRDVTVYKAVRVNRKTGKWSGIYGYNRIQYRLDEVVRDKCAKNVGRCVRVDVCDGNTWKQVNGGFFHSCESRKVAEGYKSDIDLLDRHFISDPWYQRSRPNGKDIGTVVLKCTIPKGTVCYRNDNGMWASRKIIVHSVV